MYYLLFFLIGALITKFWISIRVRRTLELNDLIDRYPDPEDPRYAPSVRSLVSDMRKVRRIAG